jgi:hypothetical protein
LILVIPNNIANLGKAMEFWEKATCRWERWLKVIENHLQLLWKFSISCLAVPRPRRVRLRACQGSSGKHLPAASISRVDHCSRISFEILGRTKPIGGKGQSWICGFGWFLHVLVFGFDKSLRKPNQNLGFTPPK